MAGEEENFALPVSINTDKKQSQTSHHVNSKKILDSVNICHEATLLYENSILHQWRMHGLLI